MLVVVVMVVREWEYHLTSLHLLFLFLSHNLNNLFLFVFSFLSSN